MEMLTKVLMNPVNRLMALLLTLFIAFSLVSGCAGDTSYDRHNKSRLWLSQDGKQIYFDATVSAEYPAQGSNAEKARLGWLADWLKLRKFCTEGYNVTERREIRADEYNPQRHDLRYKVECL